MSRRLTQAGIVLVVLFVAAQFVRPDLGNPLSTAGSAVQTSGAGGLDGILDRSCGNCHSNAATWPWYAHVAPLSWLIARGVSEGRQAVNFSEWAAYTPAQRRTLLAASCQDVSSGKMPGRPYTALRPDAQLSDQDIATICAAAREAETNAARVR